MGVKTMNWKTWMAMMAVAASVAACGGGGGGAGTPLYGSPAGTTTSTGTTTTNVTSNSAGSVVLTLSSSTISASLPATVTAVVKDATGAPISNALVQFGLSGGSSSIAQISPASAVTDANGQAATSLTPVSGATSGAAYVTASADTAAGTLTSKSAFSVSATNVTLSSVTPTPASISAYGSSAINIAVTGASSTNPVTLNISSTCATAGKATISPSTLTLTAPSGSVTYQDKACGATTSVDQVNVQVAGTTQQQSASLAVAAPVTQGIQYSSVDNSNICLMGTGCPSVANVVFKAVNSSGAPQSNVRIDFSLDAASTGYANLGSTFGTTGQDGTVTVSVASQRTPLPLRVIAQLHSDPTIQTLSNVLTISGGLPVAGLTENHTGISFASSKYALNYNLDGDSADLTLHLTDRWGAPAIDGTAVSLVSDGGTIVPAYCVTSGGNCAVKLVVSNPRPTNGRVHVIAYAKGQEYFVDVNGNGVQDGSESYDDVPVGVCLDKNENGICDLSSGEFIVGVNTNPDSGNGVWDGYGTAYARLSRVLFFSRTDVKPRLYQVSGGVCTNTPVDSSYMTVTMGSSSRQVIQFCARDGNTNADSMGGSPLASGSTIATASSNSTFTATVDNSPIPASISGPTMHTVVVQNASTATPPTAVVAGFVDLKFTMGGTTYPLLNIVTVNP